MSFNGDLYPTAGADVVMTTSGDMVKYESGARKRLGIGSTNQALSVVGGLPAWKTLSTAGSVLTTQGDVLIEGAAGLERLGQSTDGFVLTTKGASANPVWAASSGLSSPLSSNLVWNDNVEANFGTGGGDSKIYHDGSNWYFDPVTGYSVWNGSFTMNSGECMTNNTADATIASNAITGTANTMRVDTEGAAASDILDVADYTAASVTGARFMLITQSASRDVTVDDHATPNPKFIMAGDFTLDTDNDTILFEALNGRTHNYELSRSDNA